MTYASTRTQYNKITSIVSFVDAESFSDRVASHGVHLRVQLKHTENAVQLSG